MEARSPVGLQALGSGLRDSDVLLGTDPTTGPNVRFHLHCGPTGGGLKAETQSPKPGYLFSPVFHPSLQNEDGSHAVYSLTALFNRQVCFAKEAVGFGRGKAFVPEMDREFEVLSQVLGKCLNFLRLHTFYPAHTQWKPDDNFPDFVVANNPVQEREVILLVPAMESFQPLRGNAQWVRYRHADAAGADIEAENAIDSHERIIEGARLSAPGFRGTTADCVWVFQNGLSTPNLGEIVI